MWGGEPFNPDFAEVEKIIAVQTQLVQNSRTKATVEKFLVKWKGIRFMSCQVYGSYC